MKYGLFFLRIIIIVLLFAAGWSAAMLSSNGNMQPLVQAMLSGGNEERPSPADRVPEDAIHVLPDRVVIRLKDASWATFSNTNSMDPVLDEGANAIEIRPRIPSDVRVGDIISYDSSAVHGMVVHRVTATGYDNKGWYAIAQGDNNPAADPEKVRFVDVRGVVVAVVY